MTLPETEIEARFCETSVLIRIHCHKTKGLVEKTMGAIENLHITITNSTKITFASSALHLTVFAQLFRCT
ncbi:transcription factor bHLH25-like [Senna tora]|uniref:Transcription factor bHLH25-like n=1 Tax=Senna tora TaxID=362788 RepID=A0A834TQD7_9FABA|nr:transcription factor bHLH25-like [Senna tora]